MALRMTLPQFFSWAVWAAEGSEYLEKLDATHPGSSAHVPPTGTHPDLVPLGNRERPHRYRPVCGTMRRLFCGLHGGLMLGQFGSFDQLGRQAVLARRVERVLVVNVEVTGPGRGQFDANTKAFAVKDICLALVGIGLGGFGNLVSLVGQIVSS